MNKEKDTLHPRSARTLAFLCVKIQSGQEATGEKNCVKRHYHNYANALQTKGKPVVGVVAAYEIHQLELMLLFVCCDEHIFCIYNLILLRFSISSYKLHGADGHTNNKIPSVAVMADANNER